MQQPPEWTVNGGSWKTTTRPKCLCSCNTNSIETRPSHAHALGAALASCKVSHHIQRPMVLHLHTYQHFSLPIVRHAVCGLLTSSKGMEPTTPCSATMYECESIQSSTQDASLYRLLFWHSVITVNQSTIHTFNLFIILISIYLYYFIFIYYIFIVFYLCIHF